MSNNNNSDSVELRSSLYTKRLNIINDQRPRSLISYDNEAPQSPLSSLNSGLKFVPPVLQRARASEADGNGNGNGGQSNQVRRNSLGPLEDLVQCAICLDRLSDPKMLPCQHTFCLTCLQTEFGLKQKGDFHCPTCRGQHAINTIEAFNALPTNLYINSLLRLLRTSVGGNNVVATGIEVFLMFFFKFFN